MKRMVGELERIPFGYGVAWRDFAYCGSVCYPVPLNLIMRWLRELWFSLSRLSYDRKEKWWEAREREIFHRAQLRANERAVIMAERMAERAFEQKFEAEFYRRMKLAWS